MRCMPKQLPLGDCSSLTRKQADGVEEYHRKHHEGGEDFPGDLEAAAVARIEQHSFAIMGGR